MNTHQKHDFLVYFAVTCVKKHGFLKELGACGGGVALSTDNGHLAHRKGATLSHSFSGSHTGAALRPGEALVEYATYGMNSQLFVQQYQLYLPDRDALRAELERVMWEAGR